MSYQVLARKYRPRSFATLVGQEHVVRALTHALEQQRLHHAYLFTGTRGVGKTTLSRILAKSLNCCGCDGNGGITAVPCGVCEACVAIDAGRFVDYIEMDAASNRGVDEMAQLLEQAIYAPSNARFKVYMIDEVHMLTNHAFNSMLKTLEEPPEHVKFILATTDPQKIPVTVLSRCLQFNLKQMPPGHIISHLDHILGQEAIEFEVPALRLLAQGAHGSMRDALSLTDQAIAYAAGKLTLEAVQGMLGALDQSYLIRVLDALAVQNGAALLAVADEMAARSLSYNVALQDLATLLHQIALAQTVPAGLAEDLPQREDIVRLAAQFNPEEAQLFYQIVVHGRHELGLAPDEYAGFSMTLLRMLAFRPLAVGTSSLMGGGPISARAVATGPVKGAAPLSAAAGVASASATVVRSMPAVSSSPAANISGRAAALEAMRVVSGKSGSRKSGAPSVAPESTAIARAVPPIDDVPPPWHEESVAAAPKTEHASADGFIAQGGGGRAVDVAVSEDAVSVAASSAMIAQTAQVAGALGWNGNWPQLATALPLRGMVQQMAQQSELIRCEMTNNIISFHLRIPVETLGIAGNAEKLGTVLGERFGRSVRVVTEIGLVVKTASAKAQAERAERQRAAELSVQKDPFVQVMMREFGASIVPGSIRPL